VKELEKATAKIAEKNDKLTALKKAKADLETKLHRVESKLENMSKFSHIFIKSIKQQNMSLRDQVEKQKKDFDETYNATCKVIQQ
jgi:predicted nuclease with TOPRIM domain